MTISDNLKHSETVSCYTVIKASLQMIIEARARGKKVKSIALALQEQVPAIAHYDVATVTVMISGVLAREPHKTRIEELRTELLAQQYEAMFGKTFIPVHAA